MHWVKPCENDKTLNFSAESTWIELRSSYPGNNLFNISLTMLWFRIDENCSSYFMDLDKCMFRINACSLINVNYTNVHFFSFSSMLPFHSFHSSSPIFPLSHFLFPLLLFCLSYFSLLGSSHSFFVHREVWWGSRLSSAPHSLHQLVSLLQWICTRICQAQQERR